MRVFKRVTSYCLIFVMLFVYYLATPVKALAESAERAEAIETYADATNDFSANTELEYSPLVGEEEANREEFIKVFRRADGAREAVVYTQPIHYLRNGEWETIDNTLELITLEDGSKIYRNKANDFVVSFAELFSSDQLVTIESADKSLSWRFIGAEEPIPTPTPTPEPTSEPIVTPEPIIEIPVEPVPDSEISSTPEDDTQMESDSIPEIGLEATEEPETDEIITDQPEPDTTEEPALELEVVPEATSEPVITPEPIGTPDPTTAPTPAATPEPTVEPTPEPAAEPEATAEPTIEPTIEPISEEEAVFDTLIVSDAEASLVPAASKVSDEDRDMQLRFPSQLTSEIVYTDPTTGLHVRYVLSGKNLREYITLDSAPTRAVAYTVEITADGITPVTDENGKTSFVDSEGKNIFNLGDAVMFDAAGAESNAIEAQLYEVDIESNAYTYTLIPDLEWLQSDERQYPLSIDPDISISHSSGIQDSFVNKDATGSNYSSAVYMRVSRAHEAYIQLPSASLPILETGDVILQAELHLARYNSNSNRSNNPLYLCRVTSPWTASSLTWKNKPTRENVVSSLAYAVVPGAYTSFDITKLVKDWYETPSQNYGVVLYNAGSWTDLTTTRGTESKRPYFSIVYVNSTGFEDTWTYYSQNIGRAGKGSVNAFSGNLTLTHADATVQNGALPISLSHIYNGNDRTLDIGYGYGWRLNYAQSLEKLTISSNTYYRYIDGDGTRHYYESKDGSTTEYVNELDNDSVLTIDGTTITITDKGDNSLIFACDADAEHGRLVTVRDANGNETNIAYTSETFTDLRIASVTEKLAGSTAGQSLSLTYANGILSSVDSPDGLDVSYAYINGNLSTITYADNKTTTYAYDANGCLSDAANIDGYNITYSYTEGAPYRVLRAAEAAGQTDGQFLSFDYGRNKTIVTDAQGRRTLYYTDNLGQALSVIDPDGRAVYGAYNNGERKVTELKAVSKLQATVINLLVNHGFEDHAWPSSWDRSITANIDGEGSIVHTGSYSTVFTAHETVALTLSQSVGVTVGETYTFSGYFRSSSMIGAYLRITDGDTVIQSLPVQTGGTSWQRESVTFTASASSVTVAVVVPKGNGEKVYVDSLQLERGSVPNRYNMIVNGDLTGGTGAYTLNYGIDCAVIDVDNAKFAAARDTHPSFLDDSVYEMNGQMQNAKIKQTQNNGYAGETYTFGAWISSNNVPFTSQTNYYGSNGATHAVTYGIKRLILQTLDYDGNVVESGTVNIGADTDEWHYVSGTFTTTKSYHQLQLLVQYDNSVNTLYVDGIQLYKEEFATAYSYDDNGNLTGMTSLIGQQNVFNYDDNDNVTSSTDPRGNTTTYTYDDHYNLLTSTSPEGVVTSNTYNDFGLPTETKVGTDTNYIRTTTAYDGASGIAISETDALGNATTYTLDSASRTRTAITDARNNTTTYTYGSPANYGRLQSITTAGLNPVTYSYTTNGEIQTVSRGETSYNYSYDIWGRSLGLTVGATTLSTNIFNDEGLLVGVEYGNVFAVQYEYDHLDRLIAMKTKLADSDTYSTAYEYIYNGNGELYEERNYLTNRALFHEYDHAGRCVASVEKTFTGSAASLTYGAAVSTYLYHYDVNNNISKIQQSIAGSSWDMVYTYDKDNRGLTTTLENGVVLTNSYDAIGRIQSKQIGLSTPYSINASYKNGVNGSSSVLLDTYQNGTDDAYSYTYDANNNILSVTQGAASSSYVYDAANQLVRANIYNSSNDSYTATYTYDGNGNIISKSLYPYTVGDLGTATSTIQYGYAAEGWTDQLISYNGQSIVYDASGNPTTYLGQSLSWNGLQLTGVGGNISYAYDKDGIRQTKTIRTAFTQYYYNGNVLMGTYDGTNKLLFSYDEQSNVVAVDYNGTYYYYLRDGQGSVVKLIDGNGNTVVSYSYDPWGVCTTSGSMAGTLGALNPFRYHGYVYDEETGWYYLLSRYYNPTVGRYLSADTLSSTGQGVLGYNMYAYCLNNPTTNYDPSGSLSFSNLLSGANLLSIGLTAIAVGATILTCGAAAPLMVAVAAVTVTTGVVTVANGIAEVQEGLTTTENDTDGKNFMRDGFFRGDKEAYEKQRDVIATAAQVGTFICTAYAGIKGGVCFVAGTAVLTAAGQVPIESISEGDLVYASDPETGESGYKRVVQTFVNETDELVHLQYDGTTVTTTPTHPFYQPQKGWIDAIDLRAGDILVKSNGEYVVVEAVEHELLEAPIIVYNFEVEGYHTYYVGDTSVLVHNKCQKLLNNKQAEEAAKKLGYEKVKNISSHGQAVFENPTAQRVMRYITADVDSHSGGVWKAAATIRDLASKKTRTGTFDAFLRWICK